MPSADIRPELFGIIGYPLDRTGSPRIHNTAFELLGLPHRYVPLRIAPADLSKVFAIMTDLGVRGFNVTVPHKETIIDLLDTLAPDAREIGAVNTVVRTRGGWLGANTDTIGFALPLLRYAARLHGSSALMFGTGGVARAIAWVMIRRLGITALQVVARRTRMAREFVHWAGALKPGVPVSCEPLGRPISWRAAFQEAQLIVNATPVGMKTAGAQQIIPPRIRFKRGQIAYDMIYGCKTDFLARAERQSGLALGGDAMLWGQAAASFELWTGRRFPRRQAEMRLSK